MKVRVNGTERTIAPETTLRSLLGALGFDRDGIAVAVDRVVVPRSEHATRTLSEGADVEVIRAVGGG